MTDMQVTTAAPPTPSPAALRPETGIGVTHTFWLSGSLRYHEGRYVGREKVDHDYVARILKSIGADSVQYKPSRSGYAVTFQAEGWTTRIVDSVTFLFDPSGKLRIIRMLCPRTYQAFFNVDTPRGGEYERGEYTH